MKGKSRMRPHHGLMLVAVSVAALLGPGLVCIAPVGAEVIGPVVTLEVSTSTVQTEVCLPLTCTSEGDYWEWALSEACSVCDGGDVLVATINDVRVKFEEDPAVELEFSVSTGALPTTFTFTSALLAFPAVTNPLAFASAGVTLTDGTPLPGDGASLSIVPPRTGLYMASYNGGTVFAELLGSQILPPGGGTMSVSADSGVQTIPGSVTSIQGSFSFTLSANDLASGTSRFEITPEPSTFVLLACGLAALAVIWRRR